MIHAILQMARGIVRPLVTLAFSAAIIAAVFVKLLPAEALLGVGGPVIAWWVKERSDRHKGTTTES